MVYIVCDIIYQWWWCMSGNLLQQLLITLITYHLFFLVLFKWFNLFLFEDQNCCPHFGLHTFPPLDCGKSCTQPRPIVHKGVSCYNAAVLPYERPDVPHEPRRRRRGCHARAAGRNRGRRHRLFWLSSWGKQDLSRWMNQLVPTWH